MPSRVSCVLMILLAGAMPAPTFATDSGPATVTRFPTAGVAFAAPRGWHEPLRSKSRTVAWWIGPDSVPDRPSAMIEVECGTANSPSLDEATRGLASDFRGTVDPRPTTLGGERALRITARNDGRGLWPMEAFTTVHEGRLYLVMGAAIAGRSVKAEMESIRASWTWIPVEPPRLHLEFLDRPLPVGEAATINIPRMMHKYPSKGDGIVLDLGLHNFVRNEPEFLAYVQLAALPPGRTFEAAQAALTVGLKEQGFMQRPPTWKSLDGNPSRAITDAQPFRWKADGKRPPLVRWALVKLDDRHLVSVNFTIPDDDPENVKAYVELAERIARSIRPAKVKTP